MFQTEHLQEKWQPVLEHPDLPKIEEPRKSTQRRREFYYRNSTC